MKSAERRLDKIEKKLNEIQQMKISQKGSPICTKCKHCHAESMWYGGRAKRYCMHQAWRHRATRRKWIPAKERGMTSPEWCPERKEASENDPVLASD